MLYPYTACCILCVLGCTWRRSSGRNIRKRRNCFSATAGKLTSTSSLVWCCLSPHGQGCLATGSGVADYAAPRLVLGLLIWSKLKAIATWSSCQADHVPHLASSELNSRNVLVLHSCGRKHPLFHCSDRKQNTWTPTYTLITITTCSNHPRTYSYILTSTQICNV